MSDKTLQRIFERAISGESIFKNREALRSDYVPNDLPFREQQISKVAESLSTLLRGSKASNLLLYGKTGTGKTVVAKYVVERLQEAAKAANIPIRVCYCNTRITGTEYRILAEFASSLDLQIPFTGLAITEVLSRIQSRLQESNLTPILVLDEIDFLVKQSGDNILYELTRLHEGSSTNPLTLVGISNDLRFKDLLDPRVLSSLGEEEVVFPPYTADELRIILAKRASLALKEGAIEPSTINLCAAIAGSEHGDARRAVDLLRIAAELADRESSSRIEERHVRQALQKMEQDRLFDAISSLPLHAKLILVALSKLSPSPSTGELYSAYQNECRSIGVASLTQRRVTTILSELDILGIVNAQTISHGRFGRTKRTTLLIPKDTLLDILYKDPYLKS